ncbi:MAG: hypothetical protein FJ319_08065 [SAR202 cluster bacterium]|nr:hypothetical protein [SAR202 cluster bacterium]
MTTPQSDDQALAPSVHDSVAEPSNPSSAGAGRTAVVLSLGMLLGFFLGWFAYQSPWSSSRDMAPL